MTRGEIWWADFGIPFRSEPDFRRPVLVVQDDAYNRSKINTIVVVPLTTNLLLQNAPGNVFIDKGESGLSKDSVLVVSQLHAIDRNRLLEKESKVPKHILNEVENGIRLLLGIQ
jgi:mRNA interferase MazF